MSRCVGTTVRGIRTPIIKEGDDLTTIAVNSIIEASENEGFSFHDKDIIAITESVVSISEGNYVTLDNISDFVCGLFPKKEIGLVLPILSRNRFSLILKGFARGMNKITILLSFPTDEVGNGIMYEKSLNKSPFTVNDMLTYDEYIEHFSDFVHPFTGINMVKVYKELVESENCEVEFIFSNNPLDILKYEKNIINCDIHTRYETKQVLKKNGANVYGLYEIMNKSINGSGYNIEYGLLGSNKLTEEKLKLFPRTSSKIVKKINNLMYELTGKNIEVMIYGDGAFRDPKYGIWEFADPVVSLANTKGLDGTNSEIKLKYIASSKFSDLKGERLNEAIKNEIRHKSDSVNSSMSSLGTTPRRLTDLIGSLCDLTSGSGDKATPIVLVQGYFDSFADG